MSQINVEKKTPMQAHANNLRLSIIMKMKFYAQLN